MFFASTRLDFHSAGRSSRTLYSARRCRKRITSERGQRLGENGGKCGTGDSQMKDKYKKRI